MKFSHKRALENLLFLLLLFVGLGVLIILTANYPVIAAILVGTLSSIAVYYFLGKIN